MSEEFQLNESLQESPRKLMASMLFQCNLFKVVRNDNDTENNFVQCLVCKQNGHVRYIKGKSAAIYHTHMKQNHQKEYDEYIALKQSGNIKPIIPKKLEINELGIEEEHELSLRSSILVEHGFFEICARLPNKVIKANCLTCQRFGRSNLVNGKENNYSNLLAHLKRMHPSEYERYLSLKTPDTEENPLSVFENDMDIQQSVVSTIKSEDLEFVDVNQDEMLGETWDSFESSDYYDNMENSQSHTETAATSTTKSKYKLPKRNINSIGSPALGSIELRSYNDTLSDGDSIKSSECHENRTKRQSLLFRGGFFRLIKEDGGTMFAECLTCDNGKLYSAQISITSNFLSHLHRMHPKEYERFLTMKKDDKHYNPPRRHEQKSIIVESKTFEQTHFNQIVVNFLINGMHSPSLLMDPTFDTLLNDMASHRTPDIDIKTKHFHLISPEELDVEIDKRLSAKRDQLISVDLNGVSSISTAIDVWSVRQKTYMFIIANWIDSKHFLRMSSAIGCDVFKKGATTDRLCERIKQIYVDYNISNKVVAAITNNNLQYDNCNDVMHLQMNGLDNHIQSPIYLFEFIGTDEAQKALTNEQYGAAYRLAFTKFNALSDYVKKYDLPENSILNEIFNHQSVGSKTVQIYNSISNLINVNIENLNSALTDIQISIFTKTDFRFLKEYAIIFEPIATAIEHLQKTNCYYATFLPMVHSMESTLRNIVIRNEINICQPLLQTLLNGVKQTFEHLFDFNNVKCIPAVIATCTHPFFKMRWLKGDHKTMANTNLIMDLLVKEAKKCDNNTQKVKIGQTNKQTNEQSSEQPTKKFKFSFDSSSDDETSDDTLIQVDFMSFFKKPCQKLSENCLSELKLHPYVQQLFIRYNSIPPSTAALERSVPLTDLIRKSKSTDFTDDQFRKIGLLRSTLSE